MHTPNVWAWACVAASPCHLVLVLAHNAIEADKARVRYAAAHAFIYLFIFNEIYKIIYIPSYIHIY